MIGNLGQMNVLITATDRASDDIRGVQNNMRGAAQTARSMGTGLAAAGAVGVAAAAATVNEYSKFEDQMIEVQKVTGMSDAAMKSMGERLKSMSSGPLPASAQELGKIAAQAGSVGVRGEENIAKFTKAVQKMSVATRLSSQEAAEQIAKISNAFDVPMTQAENLGSSINALSNSTASWADEISQGVRRAAGAASSLGVSAQETSGIIATLIDNGMRSRRAGTRMRRVFTQMSTKASKLASVMGTSTASVRKSIEEDAVGTLTKFIQKAKETGNTQKIFSDTFGSAGKAALDMLTDVDALRKNIEKSEKAFKQNTSLQEEYENALDSVSNQAQNTLEKFQNIAITMGGELAPIVKNQILPAFNFVADTFSGLSKDTKGLIAKVAGLGGIAAVVTGGAMVLGSVIASLSAPVIALGLAVAGVIGAFGAFQSNMFGVKDAVMKMFNTAKPLINGLFGALTSYIGMSIRNLGQFVKIWGLFVEKIGAPIANFLMPTIKNLGTAFILSFHIIGKVLSQGRKLVGDFVSGAVDFFKGLVQGITDAVNAGLEVVVDFINGLIEKANKASEALGMGKVAGKLEDITVSDALSGLGNQAKKQREEMDKLRLSIAKAVGGEGAKKQVKAFQNLVEQGVGQVDDMGRAIQGAGEEIVKQGKNVEDMDITVGKLQAKLNGKSGKEGVKQQKKANKERKKLRKELMMLRKQQGSSGSGEGSEGINIENMEVKTNDPKKFEERLRRERSAAGIGGQN